MLSCPFIKRRSIGQIYQKPLFLCLPSVFCYKGTFHILYSTTSFPVWIWLLWHFIQKILKTTDSKFKYVFLAPFCRRFLHYVFWIFTFIYHDFILLYQLTVTCKNIYVYVIICYKWIHFCKIHIFHNIILHLTCFKWECWPYLTWPGTHSNLRLSICFAASLFVVLPDFTIFDPMCRCSFSLILNVCYIYTFIFLPITNIKPEYLSFFLSRSSYPSRGWHGEGRECPHLTWMRARGIQRNIIRSNGQQYVNLRKK